MQLPGSYVITVLHVAAAVDTTFHLLTLWLLAESLAATFQNNSASSHFTAMTAPVSFMRVSSSLHINLVFNVITPEVF